MPRWVLITAAAVLAAVALAGVLWYLGVAQPLLRKVLPHTPVVLRMELYPEPETLDPGLTHRGGGTILAVQSLFDTLMLMDDKGALTPGLARDIKVSPDGLRYTFTLRDVRFHYGQRLRAEDVKRSWERVILLGDQAESARITLNDIAGFAAMRNGKAKELAGVKATGPNTLEVTLEQPRPWFLAKLTHPVTAPVLVGDTERQDWGSTYVNGTGPFKLKEWHEGSRMVLEANEQYWGGMPKVDEVELHLGLEPQVALSHYKNENLDVILHYAPWTREEPALNAEVRSWAAASTDYLALNVSAFAPFRDVRVRQAIGHAIDRQTFIRELLQDRVLEAKGILPPGFPAFNPDRVALGLDVPRARQLMAEAGYKDGRGFPALTIVHPRLWTPGVQAIIQMLQQNLGIEVRSESMDGASFFQAVSGRGNAFPAYMVGWIADYPDPENFLSILFRSGAPYNDTGFSHARVDQLLDAADAAPNWEERRRLYREAEQLIINEGPWVPLFHPREYMLVKPYVHGLENNAWGLLPPTKVEIRGRKG